MSELKQLFVTRLEKSIDSMCKDIEALDHEVLDRKFNDKTRRAYDYAYEVAMVNREFVAKPLRGEEPSELFQFGEEWMEAPEQYRDKAAVCALLRETVAECTAAAENADEMEAVKKCSFAWMHVMYHDGQLNLLQSMSGDMVVHWA